MHVRLQDLHAYVSWVSAAPCLKHAEYLTRDAFPFSSRKQNKQQFDSADGNSVMFTLN